MATATRSMTVREVAQAVTSADSSVLLVSSRILHRIIRLDRRLPTFGLNIPHRKCYFLARDRLLNFVSRFELELDVDDKLADQVILLEKPDEDELLERPSAEILFDYWRSLFHVRVHLALELLIEQGSLTDETVIERLRLIGATEYAEIRSVLHSEDMLLPPRTDQSIYIEFAAVFLELWYFAPEQLAWYFPAIRSADSIAKILSVDVDHVGLQSTTRITGAAESADVRWHEENWSSTDSSAVEIVNVDPLKPSPPSYWRTLARAEKVGSLGNVVKAAILRKKAARQALPDRMKEAESLAHAELERLARRLRNVLGLTEEETQSWALALIPLLEHACQGMRSTEARLLYDLQKVCVEQERGVYSLDLLKWARSLGKVPLRRPLPLLRQVLMTKHLQSAARKLTTSRLSGDARAMLSLLIQSAVDRAKLLLRDRVRPRIVDALSAEGLSPQNAPERVAFRKIVEELLDCIVERGYLDLGLLRDTISHNNLKLPDLTSLWELLFGDLLLRIDRRLAKTLDGIYHRGPIYLRMSQRLSAMAFGTALGRSLTRYVALPFGGAFLTIESIRHVYHLFVPVATEKDGPFDPETLTYVFLLGFVFMVLIESERIRGICLRVLRRLGQWCRRAFVELPAIFLQWRWVRKLLDSVFYGVIVNYLAKPLIFTAAIVIPYEYRFGGIPWGSAVTAFLGINLLLNSPLGRYADVLITEQLVRGWRELQMRVFAGALRMVIDVFQWVLHTMEQVLYTVDEWLRFRTGERPVILALKAILGVFWSVITYVLRIYVTLLIEPQVNPIKHFPVVTVSHKIMLPFSLRFTRLLAAPLMPLGPFWANMIAGTTVFLFPGVFGFLVWELKENWRLYASNRSKKLQPTPIGSHSETMSRLLRIGFHSGTVPRLFGKLRRAGRKALRVKNWKAVHKHRSSLHHVEEAIRRFVERELLAILNESNMWSDVPLYVGAVHMACHKVTIEVCREEPDQQPLDLMFEERGGWLLAAITQQGWFAAEDDARRQIFLAGLHGLFKYAGVDLVWSQLSKIHPPDDDEHANADWWWHDLNSDGLQVWHERDYMSSSLYRFRDAGALATMNPPPRRVVDIPNESRAELVFADTPLTWSDWVDTWEGGSEKSCQLSVVSSQ
jgi:hypothetical protein